MTLDIYPTIETGRIDIEIHIDPPAPDTVTTTKPEGIGIDIKDELEAFLRPPPPTQLITKPPEI